MIEARFSEIEKSYSEYGDAISNARNSAAEIYAKAGAEVEKAKNEVADANDRIKTACVNFESSAASLKASANNLIEVLSAISANIGIGEE